jgi:hypothetical protein
MIFINGLDFMILVLFVDIFGIICLLSVRLVNFFLGFIIVSHFFVNLIFATFLLMQFENFTIFSSCWWC